MCSFYKGDVVQPLTEAYVWLLEGIPLEYHLYRKVSPTLNVKVERNKIFDIFSFVDWHRAYHIKKEEEIIELLDSKEEPYFW